MNHTFLLCGFPRSRSLWFSKFLSIPGYSLCSHEATEHASSAEEFWALGACAGTPVYGNADSANIFVLPSLLAVCPMTTVIWIARPVMDVCRSMRNAGIPCTEQAITTLITLRDKYWEYVDVVVDYDALAYREACENIWEMCLPALPFDEGRWAAFNKMRICYSKDNPYPQKDPSRFLSWVEREVAQEKESRTL